ncbi:MAG: polyprenyl synthetase family protein [Prevotella sp.]|nr:polyprenyl synthetase family protein [Prevotella sp.]
MKTQTADQLLEKVNQWLSHVTHARKPDTLYDPIRYALSMGGKRIRPVLLLLSYSLFGDDPESVIPSACAIETYHNYTLLHDDLMDKADLRRGHQTVHRKWDANTAILSGDSMLVLAYRLIAQCDPSKLKPVLDLFTETALEIGEGQQLDMDFESRGDVKEDEYIGMIRLKTSVLLACATKMGAILAGATDADADRLYRFGEQIGLAFQLQDDYLDVYGDAEVFGKAIGGDIISNKKTYMLINAFNLATPSQLDELARWTSATTFDPQEKIAAVTAIYTEIGVDKLAQERIKHYFDQSRTYLSAVGVAEERKTELWAYAEKMMKRNR